MTYPGGELQAESGSPAIIAYKFNRTIMELYGTISHGEPDARTSRLGREIKLEDFVAQLRRNARPIVGDLKSDDILSLSHGDSDAAALFPMPGSPLPTPVSSSHLSSPLPGSPLPSSSLPGSSLPGSHSLKSVGDQIQHCLLQDVGIAADQT